MGFEVIIVLKGMFKIKLALLLVFVRVNFARQAYLDTFFCPSSFLGQFFCPPHKKCGHPCPKSIIHIPHRCICDVLHALGFSDEGLHLDGRGP